VDEHRDAHAGDDVGNGGRDHHREKYLELIGAETLCGALTRHPCSFQPLRATARMRDIIQ